MQAEQSAPANEQIFNRRCTSSLKDVVLAWEQKWITCNRGCCRAPHENNNYKAKERERERALTASQTVSHANSEVGNTSMDYGISSGSGMKWKCNKKKERVRAKQELQCGGRVRFMGFREECEVSNSSLVFCPQPIILLSAGWGGILTCTNLPYDLFIFRVKTLYTKQL